MPWAFLTVDSLIQIKAFFGLRSSKDYYKRPGLVEGIYGKGHLGVSFLRGLMCA